MKRGKGCRMVEGLPDGGRVEAVHVVRRGKDLGREPEHIASDWRHVGGETWPVGQREKRLLELGHTIFKCDLSKRANNQLTEL